MKKHFNYSYFLTVFITTIFTIILFLNLQIFPFGTNTIIAEDGELFVGFYNYFISTLLTNNNFFYSFGNVLGGNALILLTYHSLSVLHFLFPLFSNLIASIHFIYFIKLNLIALSFCTLLNHLYPKHYIAKSLASFSYAFLGYNLFFLQWNLLTFQDAMMYLPLIYLGVIKIIRKNEAFLYVATLSLAILSNFYMGYMICLATTIFFIINLYKETPYRLKKMKKTLIYLFSSILSLGLASIILIPNYLNLPDGRKIPLFATENNFNFTDTLKSLFYQLFYLSYMDNPICCNSPIIFIGIIPSAFLLFYFLNKTINLKQRLAYLCVILFFILSFSWNKLNIIWHVFTQNICFNYRYSFIFSFILFLLSFDSFIKFKKLNFHIFKKPIINLILICSLLLSTYFSSYFFLTPLVHSNTTKKYLKLSNEFQNDISSIKDDSFYRIEKTYSFTDVDALLLNYNGVSNFASTENLHNQKFLYKLGIPQKHFAATYDNDIPLGLDTLLGFKYILSKDKLHKELSLMSLTNNQTYIYKNDDTFPLIFPTQKLLNNITCENSFICLNNIFHTIQNNIQNIYDEITAKTIHKNKNKIIIKAPINKNAPVYLYFPFEFNKIQIFNNNVLFNSKSYNTKRYKTVYAIGKFPNDSKIKITILLNDDISNEKLNDIKLYYENTNNIIQHKTKIASYKININMISSSHLSFLTNNKQNIIYTSTIPFDSGWNVYVDNQQIKKLSNFDNFLAFNAPKGRHIIHLIYKPTGFTLGKIISFISLFIFILLFIKHKIKCNRQKMARL